MQQIYKTLWLGSAVDYETLPNKKEWYVLHMCKEPYYTELAQNYSKEALESIHLIYFIEQENRIAFNLMDYGDKNLIPKEVFLKAAEVINNKIKAQKNILVHCTFGRSRSAAAVILYLHLYTDALKSKDLEGASAEFKQIYPSLNLSAGVRGFLAEYWNQFTA